MIPNIHASLAREDGATLSDDYIRQVLGVPPAAHAAANDAQVELLLAEATADELRVMVRDLRRRLAGAEFAARINAETLEAVRRG
jgi:hypothetical protein